MKRIFLLLLVTVVQLFLFSAFAQTQLKVINAAVNACKDMQTAIASGSTEGLRSANKALTACDPKPFLSLRLEDGEELSLDGHFVFDKEFVDSLIAGRDVYRFAQRYAERSSVRGVSPNSKIYAKTCAVAKESSVKYSFTSRGYQELAIITEPKGAVNVKIYDKTNDNWHRDTKNLQTGKAYRSFAFDLPTDKMSKLEVEIKNVSGEDVSFVILSN